MPNCTMFYVLAFANGLLAGVGDALLNRWARKGGTLWWIGGGYVCWNLALAVFLAMLVSGYSLAYSAAVCAAVNSSLILVLTRFIFREDMPLARWIGIGLVFVGLVIVEVTQ